ncbi:hypothetical protein COCNU_01G008380 [Cocos nucifera]|uniref:Uncharacterized protein n=1 Tax=Cocos nucifera TaxID=13894 RepID=A0A8K0MUR3_COCNU|nr:hypothetical protein COCNU_01G008380 [Cocos nucifera]
MAWWQKKVVFPVRRAWVAVSARVKARKNGGGILQLRDDVQTCGYQDVQVMWEILRSEMELSRTPKLRKRPFWRFPSFSSRTSPCGPIKPQHHRNNAQ